MSHQTDVNSVEYWSRRFQGDWQEKGGRDQSRAFARLAVLFMPSWLKSAIRQQCLSICDWGCALGDGTALLAGTFASRVTGIDFAQNAIDNAKKTYKRVEFLACDLATEELADSWDLVFSSNTLEHFPDPWSVASRLAKHARSGLVFLLPYREMSRISEHEYTFLPENIPQALGEFCLVHAVIFDAQLEPTASWVGQQILLVYAVDEFMRSLKLTLADVSNLDDARSLEATKLHFQLNNAAVALTELQRDNARLEAELQHERDLAATLRAEVHELQTAQREAELLRPRIGELEYQINALLRSHSWRVTAPLRGVSMGVQWPIRSLRMNIARARFLNRMVRTSRHD